MYKINSMSLKKVLNQQYGKILQELRTSFPDIVEIEDKYVEYTKLMEVDESSDDIYHRLNCGLTKDIISKIHNMDAILFVNPPTNIGIVDDTFGHIVFHRFGESEQKVYWNLLQNLVRFMVIIQNTGKALPAFENIAQSFMLKNNNIKPQDYQQQLFSQLFTDKELTNKIVDVFKDEDTLTTLFGNMGNILQGIGLTDNKGVEATEGIVETTEAIVETTETSDIGNILKIRNQNMKNRMKGKEKSKQGKNTINELVNMVSDISLDSVQIKEIQKDICESLSGDNQDISKILSMFQNNQNIPDIISTLQNQSTGTAT